MRHGGSTLTSIEQEKLPVLMVSWRGHPSINGGSDDGRISSDYVNAFCHALEYGCDVTFDSTNGFITDWKLGNTRKYRAAFFQSTSGNVNIRSRVPEEMPSEIPSEVGMALAKAAVPGLENMRKTWLEELLTHSLTIEVNLIDSQTCCHPLG